MGVRFSLIKRWQSGAKVYLLERWMVTSPKGVKTLNIFWNISKTFSKIRGPDTFSINLRNTKILQLKNNRFAKSIILLYLPPPLLNLKRLTRYPDRQTVEPRLSYLIGTEGSLITTKSGIMDFLIFYWNMSTHFY